MKTTTKKEYYILAGDEGMMKLLIEKEIHVSPEYLMIVNSNSTLGRLIKQEVKKRMKQ